MRAGYSAETKEPRFEISVAIVGYVVLLVLLLDSCARYLAQR